MKIAVLGGGMVGSFIATELSEDYDVTVFDNKKLNLRNIHTIIKDVTNADFRKEIVKHVYNTCQSNRNTLQTTLYTL